MILLTINDDVLHPIPRSYYKKRLIIGPFNRSLFFDLSFKYSIDLYDLLDLSINKSKHNNSLRYLFFNPDGQIACSDGHLDPSGGHLECLDGHFDP